MDAAAAVICPIKEIDGENRLRSMLDEHLRSKFQNPSKLSLKFHLQVPQSGALETVPNELQFSGIHSFTCFTAFENEKFEIGNLVAMF